MASALFPTMQRFVADEWIRLDSERITPWAFFNSHFGVICTDFYGKPIASGGLEFEGSIRDRYRQRFIEPFLEDLTCRALTEARKLAVDRNQDIAPVLEEAAGLLISTARKAFARMADIDRRLRGKGHPETVTLHNTDRERRDMEAFIDLHLAHERRMVTPKRSLERWYRENQFLFWVLGFVVAIGAWILPRADCFVTTTPAFAGWRVGRRTTPTCSLANAGGQEPRTPSLVTLDPRLRGGTALR